jgi:putative transcriptional regulator
MAKVKVTPELMGTAADPNSAPVLTEDELVAEQVRCVLRMTDAELMAARVRRVREKLGLSQIEFARRFRLSAASIRDWEQGRRRPDPAARVLLCVIECEPEAVDRALA